MSDLGEVTVISAGKAFLYHALRVEVNPQGDLLLYGVMELPECGDEFYSAGDWESVSMTVSNS